MSGIRIHSLKLPLYSSFPRARRKYSWGEGGNICVEKPHNVQMTDCRRDRMLFYKKMDVMKIHTTSHHHRIPVSTGMTMGDLVRGSLRDCID